MAVSMLTDDEREPGGARWALAFLLLATAPARTLTQFSVLSFTLAIAGAFARGTWAAGVLGGLALMKPQVGGIVVLLWLVRRDWRRAALAAGVCAILTLIYCLHAGVGVLAVAEQYWRALVFVHGSDVPLRGHTELRAWFMRLWPDAALTLLFAGVLAVLLLLPLMGARHARRFTRNDTLEILAFCGACSLLAVRHLSYDLLLLWPALVAWRVPPFSTSAAPAPGRRLAFLVLACLLVAGVPSWARLLAAHGAPPQLLIAAGLDRVLALGAWLLLSVRVVRVGQTAWN